MFTIPCRLHAAAGCLALLLGLMPVAALAEGTVSYESLLARLDQLPTTREADYRHQAALARADQAAALPNPTLSLEADNAYGGRPYRSYDNAETTLTVSQPLEIWGQRRARQEAAQATATASGLRHQQQRWLGAAELAAAYAEAEAALRRQALAEESQALTEADAEAARLLVAEGREAALRSLQADSEVALAQARLDDARAQRDASLRRLQALALLEQPVQQLGSSLLDRLPEPEPVMSDPLPDLRIAQAELSAARRSVDLERMNARPAVTASLGVRHYEEYNTEAFSLGISVSLPLFDRNTGAVRAARVEERAAETRALGLQHSLQAEQASAKAQREAAHKRVAATDRQWQTAEEIYRLARLGFQAGRLSALELRSSRAALLDAQNAAVDARLRRVHAEIALARLQGRIPFGVEP